MDAAFSGDRLIVVRRRKGWRRAWGVAILALLGGSLATAAGPRAARPEETAIKLTLDVTWGDPALPALPPEKTPEDASAVDLEVGEGRVIEAKSPDGEVWTPRRRAQGAFRLGTGSSGRVRVRIETTAASTLIARAGGVATQFPVVGLFEGSLRTGPNSPVPMLIERVTWDAVEVRLGPEGRSDGIFAPGAAIPTALGFNLLLPEPGEVAVRYWAELRPADGDAAIWALPPRREVMATNATRPPGVLFSIPAPKAEGSYLLEVHATWEPPSGAEGSRLARLFKKRRKEFPVSVTRRVSFAVVGPNGTAPPPAAAKGGEAVSDSVDLTRARAQRAMASGRSPAPGGAASPWTVPEAALVEVGRRDRLRGWGLFGGAGEGVVVPPADGQGLAWSAVALKVNHPGRPHRLTVRLADGSAADLGAALVAPGVSGSRPRVLLDAAASRPASSSGATPTAFSWPVWPDADDPVLVLVNRAEDSPLRLASVELRELAADPAPAALAETHPDAPRGLALHLAGPGALDRFGGSPDVWGLGQNLAAYAKACGASAVVLDDAPSDRRVRSALEGQADEDSTGPDRLGVILAALERHKLSALLEVRFNGPLPNLPPADSAEALAKGLVRVDRAGRADGMAYQPLRSEVREAMAARVVSAIGHRAGHPNVLGLAIRLGPGATLPGSPEVGLDDVTYPQFVRAEFQAEALGRVPGLDNGDPKRFEARWKFVTGPGREDWLDWRASRIGSLYGDLADAVRKASPGAVLAVSTPGLDDGPAGIEARRADRAGLAPLHAWKAVGLDLAKWPAGPVVLRGVGTATDGLAHDLATGQDLDAAVAARPGRGLWLGADEPSHDPGGPPTMTARPIADGPAGEEPLGHALAVLDARLVIVSGASAAGQEERLARFARVFRALPAPAEDGPPAPRLASGVALRSWTSGGRTFVAMANDTPYVILLDTVLHAPADASVEDLGRRQRLVPAAAPNGGRSLVLELPPFGAAALRVGAPSARVEPIGPYLPGGRDLDAQRERLSARLERIAAGSFTSGPRNGDFEDARRLHSVPAEVRATRLATYAPTLPVGWTVEGDPASSVEVDARNPRSGKSALRLDARASGASAASASFVPPGRSSLEVRAWLRSDRAEAPVRVWVEGESAGSPFRRSIDVQAGTEWSEVHLAARDLPAAGLDKVRIRFERKGAGMLWIDDVTTSGDGPPESATRAQLVLTAALHAYRERRYADFARYAGSHWAKLAEPDADAPGTPRAAPVRSAGGPTDLPAGRRLR